MYDLWGRLKYMLSPQFDIYEAVSEMVFGYVADIGSGTGFGTHLLARKADYVVGYEIDDTAMNFANRAFSNGNVIFYGADITDNGWKRDGGFDFITMIDVIEHIEDTQLALQNCSLLLKDGGQFICSTPNRLSRYRKSDYHVREYSPQEFRDLLETVFENDVDIVDFQLKPKKDDYINPILAICR